MHRSLTSVFFFKINFNDQFHVFLTKKKNREKIQIVIVFDAFSTIITAIKNVLQHQYKKNLSYIKPSNCLKTP